MREPGPAASAQVPQMSEDGATMSDAISGRDARSGASGSMPRFATSLRAAHRKDRVRAAGNAPCVRERRATIAHHGVQTVAPRVGRGVIGEDLQIEFGVQGAKLGQGRQTPR